MLANVQGENMTMGILHSIIALLEEAFKKLQVQISLKKIENLAIMVHKAMTIPTRLYHTMEHVFNLLDSSDDPLLTLAALFHDIICYQVDRGFPPEIYPLLSPYIQKKDSEIFIIEKIHPSDRLSTLTLEVFGFKAGQKLLPMAGLNEFLSALVMNKELEGILSEKDLIQITICIEATIPFRVRDERGKNFAEILEERLIPLNTRYKVFVNAREIEESIKRAVLFSNKDVENFSEQDPGKFLDSTWKLLPEMNTSLRSKELYSIRDYRQALRRMESFFGCLNPDTIFCRYKGTPTEREFQQMVMHAHKNVAIAREYLGIKLLTATILEALAEVTGGDAPLSLFMGDIRKEGEKTTRLEDFLPVVEESNFADRSAVIFNLLEFGRASELHFDMKNSPLSAFLYKTIGPVRIRPLCENAKEMVAGRMSPQEFLHSIDKPVISAIAKASASMVLTRREQLLHYCIKDRL